MHAQAIKDESNPGATADDVYQEMLCRTESKRKKNNLTNVWTALEHLRQLKVEEFTVASVGRAINGLGLVGPKTQSIRNEEGQDFRDLIRAYDAEHGKRRDAKVLPADEELVVSIPDLRTAAHVRMVLNENASLKRRIDLLHATFRKLDQIRQIPPEVYDETPSQVVSAAPGNLFPSPGRSHAFTPMEIAAVRRFIDNLDELDCTIDDDTGALLHNRTGLEIASPGFYFALRKVVNPPGA